MNIFFNALSAEFGALAQLGERLHGMEEVESSILLRSTKLENQPSKWAVFSLLTNGFWIISKGTLLGIFVICVILLTIYIVKVIYNHHSKKKGAKANHEEK